MLLNKIFNKFKKNNNNLIYSNNKLNTISYFLTIFN